MDDAYVEAEKLLGHLKAYLAGASEEQARTGMAFTGAVVQLGYAMWLQNPNVKGKRFHPSEYINCVWMRQAPWLRGACLCRSLDMFQGMALPFFAAIALRDRADFSRTGDAEACWAAMKGLMKKEGSWVWAEMKAMHLGEWWNLPLHQDLVRQAAGWAIWKLNFRPTAAMKVDAALEVLGDRMMRTDWATGKGPASVPFGRLALVEPLRKIQHGKRDKGSGVRLSWSDAHLEHGESRDQGAVELLDEEASKILESLEARLRQESGPGLEQDLIGQLESFRKGPVIDNIDLARKYGVDPSTVGRIKGRLKARMQELAKPYGE